MEARRRPDIRAIRSLRQDASNKENFCPFEATLLASEMDSRRSPLPAGFPRSPLQDITHIICPPNIWLDGEDPPMGQLHKKCKKENPAGLHAENEEDAKFANWKGLRSCVQFRFQTTEENQAEEATEGKVECVQILSSLPERCDEASEIKLPLCVYRDGPTNFGSSGPVIGRRAFNCEGQDNYGEEVRVKADAHSHEHAEMDVMLKVLQRDGKDSENERETAEAREHILEIAENRRAANTLPVERSESCKAGSSEDSHMNVKDRHMPILVAEEKNLKRPGLNRHIKKRSTLSMLR